MAWLCIILLLCAVSSVGQPMSVASAVDILQRTHADVKCDSNTRQLLNGLCDGSKDRVILGSEKGKVWVAVVSGKQRQNDRILSFPIAGAKVSRA